MSLGDKSSTAPRHGYPSASDIFIWINNANLDYVETKDENTCSSSNLAVFQ